MSDAVARLNAALEGRYEVIEELLQVGTARLGCSRDGVVETRGAN